MAEPTRPWTRSVGMRTGGMVERLAVYLYIQCIRRKRKGTVRDACHTYGPFVKVRQFNSLASTIHHALC